MFLEGELHINLPFFGCIPNGAYSTGFKPITHQYTCTPQESCRDDEQLNDKYHVIAQLRGGHTVGTVACQFISYRLYNFRSSGGADPTIDPTFLPILQSLCPQNGDGNKRIALDYGSGDQFDHSIFKNIQNNRGILESDQSL
ncbi:hypothetical protein POM88_023716 [Heracleum sosnowskyi]|uniref:peroxidase n=1 Tax=Heracleum sosnowskyi TaxID=360622 RepID=A0AAD8MUP2_9APIA|nr:hypothetical protein POM88_023716 [Heracleum sosnowskyi]